MPITTEGSKIEWRLLATISGCLALAACGAPPPPGSNDVARLMILDVAAALQLVNADARCGFESRAAIASEERSGPPGADGTVTRRISQCAIDLSSAVTKWPYFTCDQHAGVAAGRFIFSGTRVIKGRITSDDARPVIPEGAGSMRIVVEKLELDGLEIARADKAASLTLVSGSVAGEVEIVLAAGKADGFCTAPTPNARFRSLSFDSVSARYSSILETRDHFIPTARLSAVSGRVGDEENTFGGELTVDDVRVELPVSGEKPVFDTDYDRARLEATFACPDAAVQVPVSYACGDINELVAQNASRLAAVSLTSVLELLLEDKTCGFASAEVIAGAVIDGSTGARGTVTHQIRGCVLEFPKPTSLPRDCRGHANTIRGRVVVDATRTMRGTLTGDPRTPILPTGEDAMDLEITKSMLAGLELHVDDRALTVISGSLTGKLRPRIAKSEIGVCAVPTKIAELSNVNLANAKIRLATGTGTTEAEIEVSDLSAINGPWKEKENALWGVITANGRMFETSESSPRALDTAYDPQRFAESWQCAPHLAKPLSFECSEMSVDDLIAANAARVAALSVTTIISLLAKDERCGFANPNVLASAIASAPPGESGTVQYAVDRCVLDLPPGALTAPNCLGKSDAVSGRVIVSATRKMRGIMTGDPNSPVVPTDDQGLSFEITDAELEDFTIQIGDRILETHQGHLAGIMQPRVAKSTGFGVCSVPTKIARLSSVNLSDADIRFSTPAGRVSTHVSTSNLSAVNGPWGDLENVVYGSIATSRHSADIALRPATALDEAYDPATFAGTWTCAPGLATPVSFDCASELPIPETAARLTMAAMGALASLVESDDVCGFASPAARSGAQVSGTVGSPGATGAFSVPACQIRFASPTVIAEDCNGKRTTLEGTITFHATKRMTGYNTGSEARPVLPTRRDAIEFDVTADLSSFIFTIEEPNATRNQLAVEAGTLSGTVVPRLAIDRRTGACSKPTPVTTFREVSFRGATPVILGVGGRRFGATLSNVRLFGQSGSKDGVTNHIDGALTVGGALYQFPINDSSAFDPAYDAAAFDASYRSCDSDIVIPASDAECNFKQQLGKQALRGLALSVASIGQSITADASTCGLDIKRAQKSPNNSTGRLGGLGSATWTAPSQGNRACTREFAANHVQSRDCLGRTRYFGGDISYTASLTVRGVVEDMQGVRYINPSSPDAPTDYSIRANGLRDLSVADVDPDGLVLQGLVLDTADLSALIHPIMGQDRARAFTYLVPTPITRFAQVNLSRGGRALIVVRGMSFETNIASASMSGFSGSYNGESNHVTGTVTLDGETLAVDDVLDPDYEQGNFNARYRCDPDLQAVVPTRFP